MIQGDSFSPCVLSSTVDMQACQTRCCSVPADLMTATCAGIATLQASISVNAACMSNAAGTKPHSSMRYSRCSLDIACMSNKRFWHREARLSEAFQRCATAPQCISMQVQHMLCLAGHMFGRALASCMCISYVLPHNKYFKLAGTHCARPVQCSMWCKYSLTSVATSQS